MTQTIDKIEMRFGDLSQYNYIKIIGNYYKNKGRKFVCSTLYEFVKNKNGNITQLGMSATQDYPSKPTLYKITREDFENRFRQMELDGMCYNESLSQVDKNDNLSLVFCQ